MNTMSLKSTIRSLIIITLFLSSFECTFADNGLFSSQDSTKIQDRVIKPGKAKIFEKGLISTGLEYSITFTPDGKEAYFAKADTVHKMAVIMVSRFKNGNWQKPVIASFSGTYGDVDPFITPDGKKLFYASHRPFSGTTPQKDYDLWYVEKNKGKWGKPVHMSNAINTKGKEGYPGVTADGTLYYFSDHGNGWKANDIYMSKLVNGHYTKAVKLGKSINTNRAADVSPYISPDNNVLVFYSTRKGGYGKADLYVSYKKNGTWSKARLLGPAVNTAAWDVCPTISPDKKYFYFERHGNIYRIPLGSAGIHL